MENNLFKTIKDQGKREDMCLQCKNLRIDNISGDAYCANIKMFNPKRINYCMYFTEESPEAIDWVSPDEGLESNIFIDSESLSNKKYSDTELSNKLDKALETLRFDSEKPTFTYYGITWKVKYVVHDIITDYVYTTVERDRGDSLSDVRTVSIPSEAFSTSSVFEAIKLWYKVLIK